MVRTNYSLSLSRLIQASAQSSALNSPQAGDEKIPTQLPQEGPDRFGALNISRVVDLSHPVSPGMPTWPGDPPTNFDPWSAIGESGYFLRRLSVGEHSGTHLVAPATYYPDGRTVDQFLPVELAHPAVVIDVREHCGTDPDYALTTEAVLDWENRHGQVPPRSLALLMTGWSDRWNNPKEYLGTDPDGQLHFPGFGLEAAALLVNERGVAGLGTDTPGLERGIDSGFSVSRFVLSQPRIVLENLTNLAQLPPVGTVVVIGALKLQGGSGSPVAVTAILPTENA